MTTTAVPWTPERQQGLRDQLAGYWAAETWDVAQCPLPPDEARRAAPGRRTYRALHFSCRSAGLNVELQYALWVTLSRREWSLQSFGVNIRILRHLIAWLNQVAPDTPSLLERPLAWWELSFRTYLSERGLTAKASQGVNLNKRQEARPYQRADSQLSVLRRIYRVVADAYDDRSEYEKDRWDLRTLGKFAHPTSSNYWLNFTGIRQPWLRATTKQVIKYLLSQYSAAHCRNIIQAVRAFSLFLQRDHPAAGPTAIARPLIVDFVGALPHHLAPNTRYRLLVQFGTFLECCAQEGFGALPREQLLFSSDLPRHQRCHTPRFIPEPVVEQLNRHVDALPAPVMRLVLLLQECGMRIGELCGIAFDCLYRDGDGDWWLRYYQGKQRKEHTIPVLPETVAVIREQQAAVVARYGASPYLFPSLRRADLPLKQKYFGHRLNLVAYERGIRDERGALFRFEAHQFRHHVGTRMINRGYPQHVVQRFLGHESPEMTAVYAHLHDQTLKREFQRFAREQVDVTGQAGRLDTLAFDDADLQWFKRHLHAQALPHGTCWLPATQGACPHANACFTCAHWRTDPRYLPVLRDQLDQTRGLLAKARGNGWARQVEMNEQVERNLTTVIVKLEDLARAKQR